MNAKSNPRECPYVGLEPFEAAHAHYFFGRRQDSHIIADHIRTRSVVVLYGTSGVGKTSILNVGLPEALLKQGSRFTIAYMRNWQDPGRLKALAIESALAALPRHPRRSPDRLEFAPVIAWSVRAFDRPFLLILDQFEEYFLYEASNRTRWFEDTIGPLLTRKDLPFHLLIAIRDDALHQLNEFRSFLPRILDTTIKLDHLTDLGVNEAISGPIARYNDDYRNEGPKITVEPQLIATLTRQLHEPDDSIGIGGMPAAREIELPYLQLTLTKLWEAEGGVAATSLREITLVRQLGGVRKIVRDHVTKVMGNLSQAEQQLCSRIFDRLVTGVGSKIAYPTAALVNEEIVGPNIKLSVIETTLGKLTLKETRILKPVRTNGRPGFEIFHDVLGPPILEWKRNFQRTADLARAIGEERDKRQQRFRIGAGVVAFLGLVLAYGTTEYLRWLREEPWAYFSDLVNGGDSYELRGPVAIIGRKELPIPNSIRINDLAISRIKMVVFDNAQSIDLRSLNGTILNGRFMRYAADYVLHDQDILAFSGVSAFRAHMTGPSYNPFVSKRPQAVQALARGSWGMLIDGSRKAISAIEGPPFFLDSAPNGSVERSDRLTDSSVVEVEQNPVRGFNLLNRSKRYSLVAMFKYEDRTYLSIQVPPGKSLGDQLNKYTEMPNAIVSGTEYLWKMSFCMGEPNNPRFIWDDQMPYGLMVFQNTEGLAVIKSDDEPACVIWPFQIVLPSKNGPN